MNLDMRAHWWGGESTAHVATPRMMRVARVAARCSAGW